MKLLKLITTVILAGMSFFAQAQEFGLKEGKDYIKIPLNPSDAVATSSNSKKPVIVEFFWYGCPHCFKIKPLAEQLFNNYEGKITVVRYPVGFPAWESGARTFFTYQEMNILNKMHDKTFEEIHSKHSLDILNNKSKRDAFLNKNAVDVNKFNSIYNSFSINSKWNKSLAVTNTHKIEGSPLYVIYSGNNMYQVSPALTSSYDKTINNLDTILSSITK